NSAYFYDLNAKLDYELDAKNKLYFSGYFGRDVFDINKQFKTSYGNTVANLRWAHQFHSDFSSDLFLIYSDFQNNLAIEPLDFKYDSGIQTLNLIYDLNQSFSDGFKLNYGLNSKYYHLNPGHLQPTHPESGILEKKFTQKYAWENALYAEAENDLSDKLTVKYGVRLNNSSRLGQSQINRYENDQPVLYNPNLGIYEEAPVLDTYRKSRSRTLKTFFNVEPRTSLSYQFNDRNAIKASF